MHLNIKYDHTKQPPSYEKKLATHKVKCLQKTTFTPGPSTYLLTRIVPQESGLGGGDNDNSIPFFNISRKFLWLL